MVGSAGNIASTASACVDIMAAASMTNSPKPMAGRAGPPSGCSTGLRTALGPLDRRARGAQLRQRSVRRQQMVERPHCKAHLVMGECRIGGAVPAADGAFDELLDARRVRQRAHTGLAL